jgi:hypothetical protein
MAILLKRNTTPSVVPAPGELVIGELAINAADGKLFTKKTNGTVGEIGTGSVSSTISYIDGGNPDSNYGGIDPIDGGGV